MTGRLDANVRKVQQTLRIAAVGQEAASDELAARGLMASDRVRADFASMRTDDPKVLRVEKSGVGPVTGADIHTGADCDIVNQDLPICTITESCIVT